MAREGAHTQVPMLVAGQRTAKAPGATPREMSVCSCHCSLVASTVGRIDLNLTLVIPPGGGNCLEPLWMFLRRMERILSSRCILPRCLSWLGFTSRPRESRKPALTRHASNWLSCRYVLTRQTTVPEPPPGTRPSTLSEFSSSRLPFFRNALLKMN